MSCPIDYESSEQNKHTNPKGKNLDHLWNMNLISVIKLIV